MKSEWTNKDPREVLIDATRASIVVVAPEGEAFQAQAEMKHAYCVFCQRNEDRLTHIAEDAEWPSEWWWTMAPKTGA